MSANEQVSPVWLVRAGQHGGDEAIALGKGLAIIGFQSIPNLSKAKSKEDVLEIVRAAAPDDSINRIRNRASQVAAFALRINEGDIVALPLKSSSGRVALGRVVGPYKHLTIAGEKRHTRKVDWIRPDTPRTDIEQDLLYSLGAFMTVCRIQRNGAEGRFAALISGKPDPGFSEGEEDVEMCEEPREGKVEINLAEIAHDQIVKRLRERFQKHDLARLVEAVLQADGYHTHLSPPGPDGGVDILAGRGALGLDGPSLCVQVKSQEKPADVNVFRALQGTMQSFSADRGLLVCWGGVTGPTEKEARQHYFNIRVWDAGDLVKAIYRVYTKLPEEIQADLPLKPVWMLVSEDDE